MTRSLTIANSSRSASWKSPFDQIR